MLRRSKVFIRSVRFTLSFICTSSWCVLFSFDIFVRRANTDAAELQVELCLTIRNLSVKHYQDNTIRGAGSWLPTGAADYFPILFILGFWRFPPFGNFLTCQHISYVSAYPQLLRSCKSWKTLFLVIRVKQVFLESQPSDWLSSRGQVCFLQRAVFSCISLLILRICIN